MQTSVRPTNGAQAHHLSTKHCCKHARQHERHAAAQAAKGVVLLPGLGNSYRDYADFTQLLEQKGLTVEIAQVARIDWARNAAGLKDAAYWAGTLQPRPTVDWYLHKVNAAVQRLQERLPSRDARAAMLAHSAGGWLGRVYLQDFGTARFDRLVSLGSPHVPPPEGASGIVDQTRGILKFCEDNFPGAHHGEVKYVTISSKYIKGAPLRGEGSVQQKIAGQGYKQICGSAAVWGDGIVPVPSAHLQGALNVDLEGVYHSPLGSNNKDRRWYGNEGPLQQWIDYLIKDTADISAMAEAAWVPV